MKTVRTFPGLLTLGMCIAIGVSMAAGAAPAPQGGSSGTPSSGDVHNDEAAVKECYEKVRADRAKLEQDRQAWQQLRESQNSQGDQGTQAGLQSLQEQYRKDMQRLQEDRENCIKLYQELQKDRTSKP